MQAAFDFSESAPPSGDAANEAAKSSPCVPAQPALGLGTASRILGRPALSGRESQASMRPSLRADVLERDHACCHFCGLVSEDNEVHHLNGNHEDARPDNLRVADPFCHAWQHLGELADADAFMAYLPGLSPQDVNHLQRTLLAALHGDDQQAAADATALLNWMGSHRDYAKLAWGTDKPADFADALLRCRPESEEAKTVALTDLAPVFHPAYFAQWSQACVQAYRAYPVATWPQVFHDVMRAPL